jgi:alginate O-acetyltransferase complex protein AlgI
MTEFWRRWHISLSSWFRDYVYIPLGGNRRGNVYFNLSVVFFVTGMWHGASWNFIAWGMWNGLFLIIERILKKKDINIKLPKFIKWIYTMLIVMIGWVMFRSPDLTYAAKYIGVMFGLLEVENIEYTLSWYLSTKVILIIIISFVSSIPLKNMFSNKLKKSEKLVLFNVILKNIYLLGIFFISIMLIMTSTYNPFIYFRF